jgi:CBS domain-containing protein
MTRDVVALDENDRLDNIEQAMHALRFRHMPVTDGNKLVGLVSERDLLRVRASSLLPHRDKQDRFIADHVRVGDVMTRAVETVAPDAALVDVAELMQRHKLGCVPVVDRDGRLAGIITEADFVRLAQRYLPRS